MSQFIKTPIKSLTYKEVKKGITYYFSYREPLTQKVKRVKLCNKDTYNQKDLAELIGLMEDFKQQVKNPQEPNDPIDREEKNNIISKQEKTLNDIAEIYYDSRYKQKKRKLREYYNNLTDKEFMENKIVQTKLYTTKKEQFRYNKNVLDTTLGKTCVSEINRPLIDDYIENDLSDRLAQKSKHLIISQLKTIFNYSINHEHINIPNPFQNVKFQNPNRVRERVLTPQELKLLLQECRKCNYTYTIDYEKKGKTITKECPPNYNTYTSVYLAILTGARKDMILNIKKKDIDLKNKEITLVNQKAKMRHYKVPINERACIWLEKKLEFYEDNEYLIRHMKTEERQNPPQVMNDIPRMVYTIMDRLFNQGLDKTNNLDRDKVCNFHTLRRSVATNMVKNGTSIFDVMVFLNHSNVEQTMRYLNMKHNNIGREVNKLHSEIFEDF